MLDYLSTKQMAERLGVSQRSVTNLVAKGHLPHVRHGKSIRVPLTAWEAFLAAQKEEALASVQTQGSTHAH